MDYKDMAVSLDYVTCCMILQSDLYSHYPDDEAVWACKLSEWLNMT